MRVKKYWRRVSQVVNQLQNLYDFIPILAVFIRKAHSKYKGKTRQE